MLCTYTFTHWQDSFLSHGDCLKVKRDYCHNCFILPTCYLFTIEEVASWQYKTVNQKTVHAARLGLEPLAVAVSPYGWLMTCCGRLAVVSTAAA